MLHKTLGSAALAIVAGMGLLLAPGIITAHGGGGGGGGHGGGGRGGGWGGHGGGSWHGSRASFQTHNFNNFNHSNFQNNFRNDFRRDFFGNNFNRLVFRGFDRIEDRFTIRVISTSPVAFGNLGFALGGWGGPWGFGLAGWGSLGLGWNWGGTWGWSNGLFGGPYYYTPVFYTLNNFPVGSYYRQWGGGSGWWNGWW